MSFTVERYLDIWTKIGVRRQKSNRYLMNNLFTIFRENNNL